MQEGCTKIFTQIKREMNFAKEKKKFEHTAVVYRITVVVLLCESYKPHRV